MLRGLINPDVLDLPDDLPDVMVGQIASTSPLRVRVEAINSGAFALEAFGSWPDAIIDDEVRVMHDQYGGLVIVAWEPTAPRD